MEIVIAILSFGGGFLFAKALAIDKFFVSDVVFAGGCISCLSVYTMIFLLICVSSLFFVAPFALAGIAFGLWDVRLEQKCGKWKEDDSIPAN